MLTDWLTGDYLYRKLSMNKGGDFFIGADVFVSSGYAGLSIHTGSTFYINSVHALGFTVNTGYLARFTQPGETDSDRIHNLFASSGLKYKLGSSRSFFSFIAEPVVFSLFQFDKNNRFDDFSLLPGINLGYEFSYNRIYQSLSVFIGTKSSLWVQYDRESVRPGLFVIGVTFRTGLYYLKKKS